MKYILNAQAHTAQELTKHGVLSGPYFSVFGLNTEKYGPENTSYLDFFRAVPFEIHLPSNKDCVKVD